MSEMSFKINMECDSDGYVTFECPFCGSTFGLRADEVKTEDGMIDELFCPYCGLTKDTNAFWTKEVLQQINDIASNYMAEQLNKLWKYGERHKSSTWNYKDALHATEKSWDFGIAQ